MNEYATHLPILRGLCNLISPRNVLEFGAGKFSTPFFLSVTSVEKLVSVETDPEWARKVKEACPDSRLTVRKTAPNPKDFDLVFIDDGHYPPERVKTIRKVLSKEHPPVVIHDAEVPEYRTEIRGCERSILFCLDTPQTAFIWPEGWLYDRQELVKEVSRCVS